MPDAAWVGDPPIRVTKYIRQSPEPPQHAFLFCDHIKEILYGGAAGGGKSSALLLRRTFRDLAQPDALIPRSKDWLSNTDARWNDNDHRWTFPSGATLTFGYLQHEDDKLQYQGAAFQFVGFDELTQFTETQYTYLFSRCRRPRLPDDADEATLDRVRLLAEVPLRVRAASNPGGPGHEWVRQRFGIYRGEDDAPDAPLMCHRPDWPMSPIFIPAKLDDNPHLDADSYRGNLDELDHHTRRQLLDGDWDSKPPGDLFRREWFDVVDELPDEPITWVRFWDMASTEPSERNQDPDWTVGLKLGRGSSGAFYVADVVRLRGMPGRVRARVREVAAADGYTVPIRMEQESGSSGKVVVDDYVREHLVGFNVRGERSTGSKYDRAKPVSSKAEHRLVKLLRGPWVNAFLSELEEFSEDEKQYAHDDQVDALSGAFRELAGIAMPAAPFVTKKASRWKS